MTTRPSGPEEREPGERPGDVSVDDVADAPDADEIAGDVDARRLEKSADRIGGDAGERLRDPFDAPGS
jgi:hypothetical protein